MLIIERPNLSKLTTLGLGGKAAAMIRLDSLADYESLVNSLDSLGGSPAILGNGSNLLVQDADLPWILLQAANGRHESPQVIGWRQGKILVRVGAGTLLPSLINWCADQGLAGLEGLAGVPGTVGGAVAGNAGAFGNQICDVLQELVVFSPENGLQTLTAQDWQCAYRHFALLGDGTWHLAAEAVLGLSKEDSPALLARLHENLRRKSAGQPLNQRTAGSVFKNPEGDSAGRLLDVAGFRGKSAGGMRFTEKHANFLANDGQGTCAQALELINSARQTIWNQFDINLELEIKVWTCQPQ